MREAAQRTQTSAPTAENSCPMCESAAPEFGNQANLTTMGARSQQPCAECASGDSEAGPSPSWLDEEQKPVFLSALREAVCSAADDAMAGTGRTSSGCPYIEYWISYYQDKPASHVARAVARYAPESVGRAMPEIVALVAERVRRAVDQWAVSGEVTGLPEGTPHGLAGAGLIGGVFFKSRTGAQVSANPLQVRARLGAGHPIANPVRSRMESAFGVGFSHVRVHHDASAGTLANRLQARAFTVGDHIAFAGGEYRPGTIGGDALMAHELAHVVQQQGSGEATKGAYEADADRSAFQAVSHLWRNTAKTALPRLRSGLSIQRCPAQSRTTTPSAGSSSGITCTEIAPGTPATRGSNAIDASAAGIIAIARNTAVAEDQRAISVVRAIICHYFPADVPKVTEIIFNGGLDGLLTTRVGEGAGAQGKITVGRQFLEGTTQGFFARRVLQVRHELDHIDQYRSGMIGENLSDEREFLAHSTAALAEELPGTGRVNHTTRVRTIDTALGYYYCLSTEKQQEHAGRRDQILARRQEEMATGAVDDSIPVAPPTTCTRPASDRR